MAKNIFHLMFITMVTLEGLNVEKLGVNFISMDCNSNNVFQNVKVSVTTQIKENVA
jgi:hypothetical protein